MFPLRNSFSRGWLRGDVNRQVGGDRVAWGRGRDGVQRVSVAGKVFLEEETIVLSAKLGQPKSLR